MTQEAHLVQQQKNCNLNMARSFLAILAEDDENFTFQTFDDDPMRKDPALVRILNGSLEQHKDTLIQLNQRGAGVFVTINKTDLKGRKLENIKAVRGAFVDLDGAPLEPVLKAPLTPHVIIESSSGRYHAYWLIKDFPLDKFSATQHALINRFNADPVVHDLPRVMRLPGFCHLKREPFQSNIFETSNQQVFSYEEFITAFKIDFCESDSRTTPKLGIDNNNVLKSLQARNMIKAQDSNNKGQWNILCPWFLEHSTGEGGTHYFEPHTNGYQGHGFKCFHKHCENRKAEDLLDWLGVRIKEVKKIEEWEEPIPLPEGLPTVALLEEEMLPDVLKGWIWDIAERMQIPPDFSAATAIVVLSSLIGRKIGILPKRYDDWLVVPNLWGAVVGRPSLLKSPAIAQIMKPIDRLVVASSEAYKLKLEEYEREEMANRAHKEAYQCKLKKAARGKNSKESI